MELDWIVFLLQTSISASVVELQDRRQVDLSLDRRKLFLDRDMKVTCFTLVDYI